MKKTISNLSVTLLVISIIVGIVDVVAIDGKAVYESSAYIFITIAIIVTWLINHNLKTKRGSWGKGFGVLALVALAALVIVLVTDPQAIYTDVGFGPFLTALTLWSFSSLCGLIALLKHGSGK